MLVEPRPVGRCQSASRTPPAAPGPQFQTEISWWETVGWRKQSEVLGYLWPKVPQLREGTSSCHHLHGSIPAWPGGPMAREVKALSVKALSVLGLFGGTTRDSEIPGLNLGHAVSSNQAGVEFNV